MPDPVSAGGPTGKPGPIDSTAPTQPVQQSGPVSKPFEMRGAVPAGSTSATGAAGGAPGSTLATMKRQIQDALAQTADRQAVLERVATTRLREEFGKLATPEATRRTVELLRADPQFMSLFNNLTAEAARG